jgi:hypothetical protein
MKFAGVFLIFSCLYQPFASASEFAGSWKRDDTQTRLNPAPSLVIEKNSGGYHVKWSTGAAYDVIFDSREHPLPAPNLFNAASFRRTDAKTIEQDGKRAGKDAGKIVLDGLAGRPGTPSNHRGDVSERPSTTTTMRT